MKKWAVCLSIMLFSLGLVSSSGTQDIKVGTIFPRSGPTAMLGEQARRGADLARKMVNEKGGVKGNPWYLLMNLLTKECVFDISRDVNIKLEALRLRASVKAL